MARLHAQSSQYGPVQRRRAISQFCAIRRPATGSLIGDRQSGPTQVANEFENFCPRMPPILQSAPCRARFSWLRSSAPTEARQGGGFRHRSLRTSNPPCAIAVQAMADEIDICVNYFLLGLQTLEHTRRGFLPLVPIKCDNASVGFCRGEMALDVESVVSGCVG